MRVFSLIWCMGAGEERNGDIIRDLPRDTQRASRNSELYQAHESLWVLWSLGACFSADP